MQILSTDKRWLCGCGVKDGEWAKLHRASSTSPRKRGNKNLNKAQRSSKWYGRRGEGQYDSNVPEQSGCWKRCSSVLQIGKFILARELVRSKWRKALWQGVNSASQGYLLVVLLRPAVADVGPRCGACNVSYHREKPRGKSWFTKEPLDLYSDRYNLWLYESEQIEVAKIKLCRWKSEVN